MSGKPFVIALLVCLPSAADEGLWPYNQFPTTAVKTKHQFDVTPEFLNHLRNSSIKIGNGSGAFVSATGLLLTTRQIAGDCLAAHSSGAHDYYRDGFLPSAQTTELPCAGLSASVLLGIEDVTDAVKAAGTTLAQRNAAIAKAEKDCAAKTGNVCTVVRLFSGGRYDLYRYRRYDEWRLVFAPEYAIAFFGRERDSISYLRYGLNVAFLRAYDRGKPAVTPDYLKWASEGVKDGDMVFLAGNPGPTGRLSTSAQLTFLRDTALPLALARLQPRLQQLNAFAAANETNLRAAQGTLGALLTEYKSDAGKLIGLRDDRMVTRKTAFEGKIRRAVEGNAKLGEQAGKVWDEIAAAYRKWKPYEKSYQILEGEPAPGSRTFRIARQKLRGEKVDDSGDPINEAMEAMLLAQYATELTALGEKEVPLKSVNMKDAAAIAKAIEPAAQKIRKLHDEILGTLEVSSAEKIAGFRLKLFGAADYPDGTGTPRVEYGVVKGYTDRANVPQPFGSTFSGLYYRKDNEGPWQLPQRWIDSREALSPTTLLDFVSTSDIGGGDYGSPAVNQKGEIVGITFDGNLESLPVTYLYSDEQARAVHVDIRGIVEALTKVYKASELLKEIGAQ